jgi:hypothetical protein
VIPPPPGQLADCGPFPLGFEHEVVVVVVSVKPPFTGSVVVVVVSLGGLARAMLSNVNGAIASAAIAAIMTVAITTVFITRFRTKYDKKVIGKE